MGWGPRWILLALLACPVAQAQIYECPGPDGTRVFSDKKCGPNAKRVTGIPVTKKKPAKTAAGTAKAVKAAPRPAAELEQLLKLCDTGDDAACKKWTMGGGPSLLREQERQAEMACEAGSLPDCEARYCRDGATEDCRQRVLRTATLSGETWYLRPDGRQFTDDGSTTYDVRCVHKGEPKTRDFTIMCAALTGPRRCHASMSKAASKAAPPEFARLDQAAANLCTDRE